MNPAWCCCENSRLRTFPRRCADVLGWIIPGVIMAMLPKCPMCLAAYVAIWTGVGISLSAATHLRAALLVLSVGLALFMAAKNTSRLIRKFGAGKAPSSLGLPAQSKKLRQKDVLKGFARSSCH